MDWTIVVFVGSALTAVVWGWITLGPRCRGSFDYVVREHDEGAGEHGGPDPVDARVTIVCPGRNEAEHIPETLPELCEQDHPGTHVVFIDDHSDDATESMTAELAAQYPHLTVVRNEVEPSVGWVGKCWAIHRGLKRLEARETAGEVVRADWLCFTDADVHWHPALLRRALQYGQGYDADLIAMLPQLKFGSFPEALVQTQLALALGIAFPIPRSMDPDTPDALTGGAFMLVRRSLYEQAGGHEAVKGAVVEDLQLGRRLKAQGAKLAVAHAPELFWCRMYHSTRDMWEGLTKNAYAGMEYRWYAALGVFLAVTVLNILPPVWLIGAAMALAQAWPVGGEWSMAGGLAGLAFTFALLGNLCIFRAMDMTRRRLELPVWHSFLMPFGSAAYLSIVAGSIWRYYRGGNVWAGRAYGQSHTKQVTSDPEGGSQASCHV